MPLMLWLGLEIVLSVILVGFVLALGFGLYLLATIIRDSK